MPFGIENTSLRTIESFIPENLSVVRIFNVASLNTIMRTEDAHPSREVRLGSRNRVQLSVAHLFTFFYTIPSIQISVAQ